jgi:hypothetical protein
MLCLLLAARAIARFFCLLSFLSISALTGARPALAAHDDNDADWCSAAYEGAQELRLDGHLVEARQKLILCAQSSCPEFMQTDCARWDAEVDALVPSVVLTARDDKGAYLTQVSVSVDGKELLKQLDGRSSPINPGQHRFTFSAAGRPTVTLDRLIPEGDKGHRIEAMLGAPLAAASDAPAAPRASWRPVALYTLGAVGAVGLAGFGIFALSGTNAESDLRAQPCAQTRTCTTAQTDPVERKYLLADVSLAVGIVALGAATYVLFSGPSASSSATAHAASGLELQLGRERAFASFTARY